MRVDSRAPLITAVPVSGAALRSLAAAQPARYPGVLRQRRERPAGALQHAGLRTRAPRCFATRDGQSERAASRPRRRRIPRQPRSVVSQRSEHRRRPAARRSRCRSSAAGSSTSATKSRRKSSRACNCRRRTRRTPRSRCASRTSPSTTCAHGPRVRGLASMAMPPRMRELIARSRGRPQRRQPIDARATDARGARRRAAGAVPRARSRRAGIHRRGRHLPGESLAPLAPQASRPRTTRRQVYDALRRANPAPFAASVQLQGMVDLLVVARAAAAHHGSRDFDAAHRRHARAPRLAPSRTGATPPSSSRIPRSAPNTSC